MSGNSPSQLAPGGFEPLQGTPGLGQGPSGIAALQTLQNLDLILSAILTQMKNGIALSATLPTFTFGNLPSATANPGMLVFASNVRKPGEGAGAGTGMTVFSDGVSWYSTAGTLAAD
jgi:hypothetical protein